jgi:calcineurin-like phosphoesterase family protein
MPNIFFTSDTHFSHENIIAYDKRPFSSIEEHDSELIRRWNEVVLPGDIVYHLGDFCWGKAPHWHRVLDQLKGQIFLIRGSHDGVVRKPGVRERFELVSDLTYVSIPDPQNPQQNENCKIYIQLCHYAMRVWRNSGYGSWHLYGHSHGSLAERSVYAFDVGVTEHNYQPISLDRVKEIMKQPHRNPTGRQGGNNASTTR